MSVIIETDTDRFVELDVKSITAEDAESSDAPTVDRSPETRDSVTETGSRRRIPRLAALGGLALGVAVVARGLRSVRGRGDRTDSVEFEADEADAEN